MQLAMFLLMSLTGLGSMSNMPVGRLSDTTVADLYDEVIGDDDDDDDDTDNVEDDLKDAAAVLGQAVNMPAPF